MRPRLVANLEFELIKVPAHDGYSNESTAHLLDSSKFVLLAFVLQTLPI